MPKCFKTIPIVFAILLAGCFYADFRLPDVPEEPPVFVYRRRYTVDFGDVSFPEVQLTKEEQINLWIESICAEYQDLDPNIVKGLVWVESRYTEDAVDRTGRFLGLMQIDPQWQTARMEKFGVTDLLDGYSNLRIGIDYLADCITACGDIRYGIMSYNLGPTWSSQLWAKGVVNDYTKNVLYFAERFKNGDEPYG